MKLVTNAFKDREITEGMYRSMVNSINKARLGNYRFHYDAPVLVIVANQKDYGNNMADTACALENKMIMANALDLVTCWINQLKWLNEEPSLVVCLRTLGLKENERVYGSLAVGYPNTTDGLPVREPLKRHGNEVTVIED